MNGDKTLQKLLNLPDVFVQFLQLARSLKFYGYIQFKPCLTNYPEEDTRVIISIGNRELKFRLQTPNVSKYIIQMQQRRLIYDLNSLFSDFTEPFF